MAKSNYFLAVIALTRLESENFYRVFCRFGNKCDNKLIKIIRWRKIRKNYLDRIKIKRLIQFS